MRARHGWGAACLVFPLAAALLYDPWRSFHVSPDQDLVFVYEALRMGQGLRQEYVEHTGYLCFLALSWWLTAAKALGLVAAARLDQLPAAGPAFDAALHGLTVAGRAWSAVLGAVFVVVMHGGLRRLTGSAMVSLAATAAFATSNGLLRHSLVMRTEHLAALCAFAAFFLLLRWTRAPERPWLAVATGLAATFALMAKMQAVFLVLAFPVLALAYGEARQGGPSERDDTRTVLWLMIAAILALPAGTMVATSIAGRGLYQGAVVAYAALALLAYARLCRVPAAEAWRGAAGLVAGLSVGLLLHLLRHNMAAVEALVNFVEHMGAFSVMAQQGPELAWPGPDRLIDGVGAALSGMPWRQQLCAVAALGLAAWAWRAGQGRIALRAVLLVGVGLGFVAASSLRGYLWQYQVFVEGWLLLAVAQAAAALPAGGRALAAGAMALLAASQLTFLVDGSLLEPQGAGNACFQANYMSIRDALCR